MSRRNYSSLPPSEVFTCHTNGFTKGLCSITEKAVRQNWKQNSKIFTCFASGHLHTDSNCCPIVLWLMVIGQNLLSTGHRASGWGPKVWNQGNLEPCPLPISFFANYVRLKKILLIESVSITLRYVSITLGSMSINKMLISLSPPPPPNPSPSLLCACLVSNMVAAI